MKNIVIDTSALIAVILNESEKEKLVDLTLGMNLIAPSSLNWEVGNAFSAMFKKKRLSLFEAQEAINMYKSIPIRFVDVNLAKTMIIAHEANIYAYDAYMIVCSLKYKIPLLTLDEPLKRTAVKFNVKILGGN